MPLTEWYSSAAHSLFSCRTCQIEERGIYFAFASIEGALLMLMLVVYFIFMTLARRELTKLSYTKFRTANLAVRFQARAGQGAGGGRGKPHPAVAANSCMHVPARAEVVHLHTHERMRTRLLRSEPQGSPTCLKQRGRGLVAAADCGSWCCTYWGLTIARCLPRPPVCPFAAAASPGNARHDGGSLCGSRLVNATLHY